MNEFVAVSEVILTHCQEGFIQIGFTSKAHSQQILLKAVLIRRHCTNLPSREGKETINTINNLRNFRGVKYFGNNHGRVILWLELWPLQWDIQGRLHCASNS